MSKNLGLLKQEFSDSKNEGILKYLIPVLEDNEKKIEALFKEIEKLEQVQTYFPLEYHGINETGGVNNVKVGFTKNFTKRGEPNKT